MSKVIGQFGKGIEGSLSINFSASGSENCATSCRHHPQSTAVDPTLACYAAKLENRHDRKELRNKLERHENMNPAQVCGRAIWEIMKLIDRGKTIPWVRISTNGSVPMPSEARRNKLFITQFRALLQLCKRHGIPTHFPVESRSKARFYRELVGGLVTVRESLQSSRAITQRDSAVSIVAGDQIRGEKNTLRKRIAESRRIARIRREKTGRKAIVCPAVVASFNVKYGGPKNPKAKCGSCTACAEPHMDIVYPMH